MIVVQPHCCPLYIQAHVIPGTIIHSEWSVYHRVGSLQNVAAHETVNHPIKFVNPTTGAHTQNIGIGPR